MDISALILPNDTSAVKGRMHDRRSGTLSSAETGAAPLILPAAAAPAAATDGLDNRLPILPLESLSV